MPLSVGLSFAQALIRDRRCGCEARTGNGHSRRYREALGRERRFLRLLGQRAWCRYGVAATNPHDGSGILEPVANPEQVALLRQGAVIWNEWRAGNPDIRPDLVEAALGLANLIRADLSGANLIRA